MIDLWGHGLRQNQHPQTQVQSNVTTSTEPQDKFVNIQLTITIMLKILNMSMLHAYNDMPAIRIMITI